MYASLRLKHAPNLRLIHPHSLLSSKNILYKSHSSGVLFPVLFIVHATCSLETSVAYGFESNKGRKAADPDDLFRTHVDASIFMSWLALACLPARFFELHSTCGILTPAV